MIFSFNELIRQSKNYFRYIKFKDNLPQNPMHDDIYIVEFPKSGITWLQHIIGNIELQLAGNQEIITFYNYQKYLPDVHQAKGCYINRFLARTFIKSHSEYNPFYYFAIYLIRNPFDVMVSYYNFLCNEGYECDFETFVKDKNLGIKKWKKHVNSWYYKEVKAQRIHFIKYENLLNSGFEEIFNLYKNLGLKIPEKILIKAFKNAEINNMQYYEDFYRQFNPNYKMYFVGKANKRTKEQLLTQNIKNYIISIAKIEIKEFYPELLKED